MLSQEERGARHAFYSKVFGKKRLRTDNIFTDHLWPVASYDEKVAGLLERGFKDPQKMITSWPAILNYSFENIDHKLRLCGRLRVDVEEFISYTIVFIGMSSKHYIPIARKCRELKKPTTPKNVFAIYRAKTF